MLGHLGLAVSRLIRVSFGPFQLGDLAEGAIEEVKTRVLREQLGERVVAAAGADFSAAIAERGAPAHQLSVIPGRAAKPREPGIHNHGRAGCQRRGLWIPVRALTRATGMTSGGASRASE